MAYDESLVARLRAIFSGRDEITEKKMFGGIAFMLRGNMCCGVTRDELMLRVGPEQHEIALAQPHARAMDFTGKPMKGYVYVAPEGVARDADLRRWVTMSQRFVGTLPAK